MADINRSDAEGLLADQEIREILQDATPQSAALSTFRTIRMGSKIAKLPIATALVSAGFVNEDSDASGIKPTSEAKWEKKTLEAEEIAVIVPIHEDVFDDSEFGVWEQVRPQIAAALASVLDGAVLFGTNLPSTWPDSLVEGAIAANQDVADGGAVDLAEDINLTWAEVEAVGYDVNVQYASRRIRSRLRGLRDENNAPIYLESLRSDGADRALMGEPIVFVNNGAWDDAAATLIAGDRNAAILGVRSDVSYKILDQATLTVGAGTVNLAERDMIALRAKFRVGYQVADVLKYETGDREWPFAVLTGAGS